jgi:signal peptidase I
MTTARRSAPSPSGRLRRNPNSARSLAELAVIVALAVGVALLVRNYVVQSFSIPSPSMTPTLATGDRLLVEKLSFQVREVRRNEIVVFRVPESVKKRAGTNSEDDFVKRVVGLPGDIIQIANSQVTINGKVIEEKFLPKGTQTSDLPRFVVPIDEYFVMGDNRTNSFDSRYWGTVPRKNLIGRVVFRFWPLSRVGGVS